MVEQQLKQHKEWHYYGSAFHGMYPAQHQTLTASFTPKQVLHYKKINENVW